jgi:hypothetical protein
MMFRLSSVFTYLEIGSVFHVLDTNYSRLFVRTPFSLHMKCFTMAWVHINFTRFDLTYVFPFLSMKLWGRSPQQFITPNQHYFRLRSISVVFSRSLHRACIESGKNFDSHSTIALPDIRKSPTSHLIS